MDPDLFDGLLSEGGGGAYEESDAHQAPDSWGGPTREEWEALQSFQQNAAPFLGAVEERLFREQPQYEEEPVFDPFDPDSVRGYVEAQTRRMVEERMGPISPVLDFMASQASEQIAKEHLDRLENGDPQRGIQGIGEFDHEQAILIASGMIDPDNPYFDATAALRQAALHTQNWEQKIRSDERAKFDQRLQTNGEAPRTGPFGGGSGETMLDQQSVRGMGVEKYELAIRRGMARPTMPTG